MSPVAAGSKLTARLHAALLANVPGVEEPVLITGHADEALLSRTKPCEILGLLPPFRTGNASGLLPMFSSVTI